MRVVAVIALLAATGCHPMAKATRGTVLGSSLVIFSGGRVIQVKSPVQLSYVHRIHDGGAYDTLEIEVAGAKRFFSTEGCGPGQIFSGGATNTVPAGRIASLEFDAKGDLTMRAVPDPLLTPSPAPTK